MSEFLLYRPDRVPSGWLDRLSPQELADRIVVNPRLKYKYDIRLQLGDIVEVRRDGAPHTARERQEFYIVKVPQISYKDAIYLMDRLVDNTDPDRPVMLKIRKHYIDISALPTGVQTAMEMAPVSINANVFNSARAVKSG